MRWSIGFGPFRVYGGRSRQSRQAERRRIARARQREFDARSRQQEAREDFARQRRVAAMSTEEYARTLGYSEEEVQHIILGLRHTEQLPEVKPAVDAEIARLKQEMGRATQTHTATLKFPGGREQVCCDTGHRSAGGARQHAEQLAAELGYDAHEDGAEETPP